MHVRAVLEPLRLNLAERIIAAQRIYLIAIGESFICQKRAAIICPRVSVLCASNAVFRVAKMLCDVAPFIGDSGDVMRIAICRSRIFVVVLDKRTIGMCDPLDLADALWWSGAALIGRGVIWVALLRAARVGDRSNVPRDRVIADPGLVPLKIGVVAEE